MKNILSINCLVVACLLTLAGSDCVTTSQNRQGLHERTGDNNDNPKTELQKLTEEIETLSNTQTELATDIKTKAQNLKQALEQDKTSSDASKKAHAEKLLKQVEPLLTNLDGTIKLLNSAIDTAKNERKIPELKAGVKIISGFEQTLDEINTAVDNLSAEQGNPKTEAKVSTIYFDEAKNKIIEVLNFYTYSDKEKKQNNYRDIGDDRSVELDKKRYNAAIDKIYDTKQSLTTEEWKNLLRAIANDSTTFNKLAANAVVRNVQSSGLQLSPQAIIMIRMAEDLGSDFNSYLTDTVDIPISENKTIKGNQVTRAATKMYGNTEQNKLRNQFLGFFKKINTPSGLSDSDKKIASGVLKDSINALEG